MTPLVLLHGFPFDSGMWHDVSELLGEADVPSIAIDAPGFGSSPVPEGEPALEVAADGIAATLDELGIERVVLAGLSMGGYLAMAFAERHPERLAGIALLDTKATADPEAARENRLRIAAQAEQTGSSDPVAGMWEVLLGESTRAGDPEIVAQTQEWLAAAPPAGITWGQRAMAARPDRVAVLESLVIPGLVIRGDEDVLCAPEDAATMVAALSTGADAAQLVTVEAAGHMSAVEEPETVTDALVEFWQRNSRQ